MAAELCRIAGGGTKLSEGLELVSSSLNDLCVSKDFLELEAEEDPVGDPFRLVAVIHDKIRHDPAVGFILEKVDDKGKL